jgi:hypothetical protein
MTKSVGIRTAGRMTGLAGATGRVSVIFLARLIGATAVRTTAAVPDGRQGHALAIAERFPTGTSAFTFATVLPVGARLVALPTVIRISRHVDAAIGAGALFFVGVYAAAGATGAVLIVVTLIRATSTVILVIPQVDTFSAAGRAGL